MSSYMVKKTNTEGNCLYCSKSYSGIAMTRISNPVRKGKIFT